MKRGFLLTPALSLLVLSCQDEPVAPSADAGEAVALTGAAAVEGPPSHAVVTFGRNDLGSGFFPPGSHDNSFRAVDAIRPRTVVISAGGTVDFQVSSFHKIAIYVPGTSPDDIDTSLLEDPGTPFPFPPIINDPDGRITRGSLGTDGGITTFSWTFTEPGKYLVICEVLPHFQGAKMYAWVDVK